MLVFQPNGIGKAELFQIISRILEPYAPTELEKATFLTEGHEVGPQIGLLIGKSEFDA